MNYKLKGHDNGYIVENTIQIFYPYDKIIKTNDNTFVESGVTDTHAYATFYKDGVLSLHFETPWSDSIDFYNWDEQKIKDRDIKFVLYKLLEKHTGKTSPWGLLTGIRPIKLIRSINEKTNNQAYRYFTDFYLVNEQKALKAIKTYFNQHTIIDEINKNDINLYINIPFCPTKCSYCSFTAYAIDYDKTEDYIQALLNEIDAKKEYIQSRRLNTVYFGGGTPTSITSEKLDILLNKITNTFDLSNIKEFTVEAGRPDTISEKKLNILKKYGVTRISINPQTTKQSTLDTIGRHHSVDDFYRAFRLARKMGFDNINTDIIIGLTGETVSDVEKTMKDIIELNPENITVHTLAIKKGAKLKNELEEHQLQKAKEIEEMQAVAERYLTDYHPYYLYRNKKTLGNTENIGYAKLGYIGHYNIQTMEDIQDIVALGCGAVSKTIVNGKIDRQSNDKNLDSYIRDWM